MANDIPTHMSMIAYLPYSELSDRVEQAISAWLSNKTNLSEFEKPEDAEWVAVVHVSIAGVGRHGKLRMQSPGQLMLRGNLIGGKKDGD